jgi:hypothetical protein
MSKPWHEMTPAERLADRIAKNRQIEQRVVHKKAEIKTPAEVTGRRKAVSNLLDKFQEIKRTQGIDAASDFVRDLKK